MNTLKFTTDRSRQGISGQLVYIAKDYALNFLAVSAGDLKLHAGGKGISAIAFDTLQLLVSVESRALLHPFGYFPRTSWIKKPLPCICAKRGLIILNDKQSVLPDVSMSFEAPDPWVRLYDENTGWLYYGPRDFADDPRGLLIEFAENSIACLSDQEIRSLWMKPVILG